MTGQASKSAFADSVDLYEACGSADLLTQTTAYEALWGYLYRVALQIVRDQPEAEALAQDCAQDALERIHKHLSECNAPAAFRAWARRIVQNVALDRLRRRKRITFLDDDGWATVPAAEPPVTAEDDLFGLIAKAPISERSRRVVLGRYQRDIPDEVLAQEESQLAGRPVRPSHVQVTRAKNIAKLRDWEHLQRLLS